MLRPKTRSISHNHIFPATTFAGGCQIQIAAWNTPAHHVLFYMPGILITLMDMAQFYFKNGPLHTGHIILAFFALLIFAMGRFLSTYRKIIICDQFNNKISLQDGFWHFERTITEPFDKVQDIAITQNISSDYDIPDHVFFQTTIRLKNGRHLILLNNKELSVARHLATICATNAEIPVVDLISEQPTLMN